MEKYSLTSTDFWPESGLMIGRELTRLVVDQFPEFLFANKNTDIDIFLDALRHLEDLCNIQLAFFSRSGWHVFQIVLNMLI